MNIKKAKRGRKYQYEFSFKRKVCEELLQGQITIPELSKKYNLPGGATVYRWLKWYEEEQKDLVSSLPMENQQSVSRHRAPVSALRRQGMESLGLPEARQGGSRRQATGHL